MTENPGFLMTLFAFLIVIGALVFVHEMGHYWVARWCGVKADSFSIGFGREIAGWTDKRGTRWKLSILPLGGYVQFAGDMDPASTPSEEWLKLPLEERNVTFQSKPLWKRAAIVFAGPAINFLFAMLILGGFAMAYGESVTPPVVGQVMEKSAAEAMGLKAGDRIAELNGEPVDRFGDLAREISIRADEPVSMTVVRDGEEMAISGTVGARIEKDRFGNEYRYGQLGVVPGKIEIREVSLFAAPRVAVQQTVDIVDMITTTMGQVLSGRRSVKDLGGPLKIAQISGEQFAMGLNAFIFFVALISINLGFINLLPIPMLDGGHLLFYAIEAVRRKPASPMVQEWAFRSGFALVVAFMLMVTFNDLSSFGLFRSISG